MDGRRAYHNKKRIKAEEIKYKEDRLIYCNVQRNKQAILVIDN
jgi:hypothetical protein